MEANQVSKTAMGTAFMRAYHAACDHPKIFDDFLAQHLITAEELRIIEERHLAAFQRFDPAGAASCPDRASALAGWMQSAGAPAIVFSRARYTEDILETAVRQQEVKQYVILGAGMDTFAVRRPDLVQQLQVFEVDHPATQAHKRQRLQSAGRQLPPQLQFIPVDFSRENLAKALGGSAYDPQASSFFSWLGVTYYLTREAVFATLRGISEVAPPGSTVIFDYLDSEAFVPERVARRVHIMMQLVERVGEPMLTGFDPASLAADLACLGLRLQENLSPSDIEARFFAGRTDGYRACEHAHLARATVV
ncbi:MAG: SAM-dependent methyltransferase [Deltaproteobacteria bacterium]|nr:SAM-dependent methyltransferase [Deltaproteobacteria bacterium]